MLAMRWNLYDWLTAGLRRLNWGGKRSGSNFILFKKKVFLRFLARAAVSVSVALSPPPLLSSNLPPWPTITDFGHRPCNVCSTFWVYFGEGSCLLSKDSPCCPFVLWVHTIGPSLPWSGALCLSPTGGWCWTEKSIRRNIPSRGGATEYFPRTALSLLHTNPITNKLAHGFKHESDLDFSPPLLTVLNLFSVKTQLWEEILAPKLKRDGMQLSQISRYSEAQRRNSELYFSGKNVAKRGSLGFPRDCRLAAGRLVFPGLTWLPLWVPFSTLGGCSFLSGLFLNGEEFIPRVLEGEKECFQSSLLCHKRHDFFWGMCQKRSGQPTYRASLGPAGLFPSKISQEHCQEGDMWKNVLPLPF